MIGIQKLKDTICSKGREAIEKEEKELHCLLKNTNICTEIQRNELGGLNENILVKINGGWNAAANVYYFPTSQEEKYMLFFKHKLYCFALTK